MKLKLKLDGYDANSVTLEQLEDIYYEHDSYEEAVCHFLTSAYLVQNLNFKYNITKLNSTEEFEEYLSDRFIYDFDECYCVSWFIDDNNTFQSLCLDDGEFIVFQRKIETEKDKSLIEGIRLEFDQWEFNAKD